MNEQLVSVLIDHGGPAAILLFVLYGLWKIARDLLDIQRNALDEQKKANKEMLAEFRSASDKDRQQQQQYIDKVLARHSAHDTKIEMLLEHARTE